MRIEFAVQGSVLEVCIVDNGVGFVREDYNSPGMPGVGDGRHGNGLLNMHERLESVEGSCSVSSAPARGTRAVFTVLLK